MRGRDVILESLVTHGAEYIFGNPGTTESPLTDHLHAHPALSYIVSLHEGVSIGAASYYAQASGRTGIVNLHVAPGLGNAIGMLYGALKANSPMVVTAGQQDTRLRLAAPLLGHDLVAMAAPVVKWAVQAERADECADIMRRAFKIAHDPPAGPVFVALPIDVMEAETEIAPHTPIATPPAAHSRAPGAAAQDVAEIARHLLAAEAPVLIVGDDVARARAGDAVIALAEALGAPIWDEVIHGRQAVANSHPNYRGFLPGTGAAIAEALGEADAALLLGGPFFEEIWYSGAAPFPVGCKLLQIEQSAERLAANHPLAAGMVAGLAPALAALAEAVKEGQSAAARVAAVAHNQALAALAAEQAAARAAGLEAARGRRPMPLPLVMHTLAEAAPEGTVIVEEAITGSPVLTQTFRFETPEDYFCGRGGGIGQGIAGALGVSLALPTRPLICVSGDGSAMYSITALWTAAHHKLPIIFVILANREYRILKHNIDIYRTRFAVDSNQPYAHLDLLAPELGFVEMAAGMGVKGVRVSEPEELAAAVETAAASGEAWVIEVAVEGKR
jgi:benzoylformate decarboxylase